MFVKGGRILVKISLVNVCVDMEVQVVDWARTDRSKVVVSDGAAECSLRIW